MTAREPRFEIVRSDAGWHARFRAANGRIVWVTESYSRERAARAAIRALLEPFYGYFIDNGTAIGSLSSRDSWNKVDRAVLEVRHVDERTAVTP